MVKFVVEFMDDIADSVEYFCYEIFDVLIRQLIIVLFKMFIVLTYPLWIVPYKIFRKTDKNKKLTEAYASEGEEKC